MRQKYIGCTLDAFLQSIFFRCLYLGYTWREPQSIYFSMCIIIHKEMVVRKMTVSREKRQGTLLHVVLTNHAVHRLSQRLGHDAITRIRAYLLNERVTLFKRGTQIFLTIPTMGTFVGVQENHKFIVKTVLYSFLEQTRSLQFLDEYPGAIVMVPYGTNTSSRA